LARRRLRWPCLRAERPVAALAIVPVPLPPPAAASLVPVPGSDGALLLSPCPGWFDRSAPQPGTSLRMLADLRALSAAGVRLLLTLLADDELARLGASRLVGGCNELRIDWTQCPIEDFEAPGTAFESDWRTTAARVHARLDRGERIGIHCRAGLGRSGTVAARILVERGLAPAQAIAWVRQHRRGAIETPAQQAYVSALTPAVTPVRR
jgi:protein-tyrosine phosphatase